MHRQRRCLSSTLLPNTNCYHCGEAVAATTGVSLLYRGQQLDFCCPACQTVFECISDNGFEQYYLRRQQPAQKASSELDYSSFDTLGADSGFIDTDNNTTIAQLLIGGVHCSACAWLIETRLNQLAGVTEVQLNLHRRQLRVQWQTDAINLSDIMTTIHALGYEPGPWLSDARQELYSAEKAQLLKRLGIAGLLMMQVGMLSIGLYAGDWQGMDVGLRDLLRAASALLATVALVYCASPFFSSARRALVNRSLNMDVPIALALTAAYAASLWAFVWQRQAIYFDTVCMFVFFLILSRFIELRSREPAQANAADLLPLTATRRTGSQLEQLEIVPLSAIEAGDSVLCSASDKVPVDAIIAQGSSSFDESIFTGESTPCVRRPGDRVLAGSLNLDQSVWLTATATASNASILRIEKILDSGMVSKPAYARSIDAFSPWFVAAVLVCALASAIAWFMAGSDLWLEISLAVLVVSCPCALALATPVAIAMANTRLRASGILPLSQRLLEQLPHLTDIVFDKTGTLTNGFLSLVDMRCVAISRERALALAASLESVSNHPIANSIRFYAATSVERSSDARLAVGYGVEGSIAGVVYRFGKPSWCAELYGGSAAADSGAIELCDARGVLARFYFNDSLRGDAKLALAALSERGYRIHIMSGDAPAKVAAVAAELGVSDAVAAMQPEQKLAALRKLQAERRTVLMVGDGVNDAPVLAAADVSIAMTEASDVSKSRADAILLAPSLGHIIESIDIAKRCRQVIGQNIIWAALYNAIAIPLAAFGFLPPWLAAIGMSVSSLGVVLNSRRLRSDTRRPIRPKVAPLVKVYD